MKRVFATASIVLVLALAALGCNKNNNHDTTGAATNAMAVNQTNMVSDQAGAKVRDEMLVNAWGLAFNPKGVAWVSATENGVAEAFDATGKQVIPAVQIPTLPGASEPSSPTGQVFNDDDSMFQGDSFIIATEQGTIAGWSTTNGTQAVQRIDNSANDASYKGVTIVRGEDGAPRLYAADFHNGKIDVFDANYQLQDTSGQFSDSSLPDGFAPFNVENFNDRLIVTYAKQDKDKADDEKGAGNGYVDLYATDGSLLAQLAARGDLNSPWGIALAPQGFDAAPGRLLIGNFGDGRVLAFAVTGTNTPELNVTPEGPLQNRDGHELAIDGLWALKFGPGAGGFDADQLYFTAGPGDEEHGLFGRLDAVATNTNAGGTSAGPTTGSRYY